MLAGFGLCGLHAAWVLSLQLPVEYERSDLVVSGKVLGLPEHDDDRTRFLFRVDRSDANPGFLHGRKLRLAWYDGWGDRGSRRGEIEADASDGVVYRLGNWPSPYAIVLANASTDFDAQITVWSDDGEFAVADAERLVGADIQFPGDDLVTVRSELVDHDGVRLLDISGPVDRIPLPRRSMMTLVLPPRPVPFGASTVRRIGYKIESTQPIVAYQFNPLCCNYSFTNDASLLLPTSALTQNYSFLSYEVWRPQFGSTSYSSTMTVVARWFDWMICFCDSRSESPPSPGMTEASRSAPGLELGSSR